MSENNRMFCMVCKLPCESITHGDLTYLVHTHSALGVCGEGGPTEPFSPEGRVIVREEESA
jgi:hypothetical protein